MDDIKKWTRRTHRSRRARRAPKVYNTTELIQLCGCADKEELERELKARGIKYHKDSSGEIWVSKTF